MAIAGTQSRTLFRGGTVLSLILQWATMPAPTCSWRALASPQSDRMSPPVARK